MEGFLRRFFSGQRNQAKEKPYPPVPPRPAKGADELAALDAAGQWLDAAILRDTRAIALGEERSFHVDQNTGRLTLSHADGWKVDLDIQILASFRPHDRSLRWSWANSGVDPRLAAAASAARDHASTKEFASFHTPTFQAKFEDCVQLVALAARLGGCDGVYRCLTDGSLTVFAGYKAPAGVETPPAHPENEAKAVALLDAYDAEMLPIDEAHYSSEKSQGYEKAVTDRLLAEKMAIYKRYWRRNDQYWEPCSFAWPSDHERSDQNVRFAAPRRAGGVYVITVKSSVTRSAHVVEVFDDGPRITDQDLDWGRGVLLSSR